MNNKIKLDMKIQSRNNRAHGNIIYAGNTNCHSEHFSIKRGSHKSKNSKLFEIKTNSDQAFDYQSLLMFSNFLYNEIYHKRRSLVKNSNKIILSYLIENLSK